MVWTVEWSDTARRDLRKLDKSLAERILNYMDQRVAAAGDPRALGKALRGPLGELWRYRVGDSRVLCELQDAKLIIIVVRVGNRKDIYR